MNRRFKITAAVLAAAICTALTGCGSSEKKEELNNSKIESRIESVIGGGTNDPTPSTPSAASTPEEVKFVMTDEIKNSALDSGSIQINNEIFRQGGYITAADLVEKYKDAYDIDYIVGGSQKPYDECKEYLIEYIDPNRYIDDPNYDLNELNVIKLTPKIGESKDLRAINAVIGNFTSPDEKITVDKAIVIGYNLDAGPANSNGGSTNTVHHVWLPQGLGLTDRLNNTKSSDPILRNIPDDLKQTNEDHTLKSFTELLEQQGFSASDESIYDRVESENSNTYNKKYYKYDNYISVYGVSEQNLFGKKPVYKYRITFNKDTDKIDKAGYCILGFVDQ